MNVPLLEASTHPSDPRELSEARTRKLRILVYIQIIFKFLLCIVVIALVSKLSQNGLGNTKKYLGFCQAIIGVILILLLILSMHYRWKTLILTYIVSADILSFACGIMSILLKVSDEIDFQTYNGQAPLTPAHKKDFFKINDAFFILSLVLALLTIASTFFVYQLRKSLKTPDDSSQYIKVVTRHSSSKMVPDNLQSSRKLQEEEPKTKDERATPHPIKTNNTKIPRNSQENSLGRNLKYPDSINNGRDALDIEESSENSFHNSPQSSKKIKLGTSHGKTNSILEERKEIMSAEQSKPEKTKTIISDLNKIESFLYDTPIRDGF